MAIGGGIGGLLIVVLALILGVDPSLLNLDPGTSGTGGNAGVQDATAQKDFNDRCVTGASAEHVRRLPRARRHRVPRRILGRCPPRRGLLARAAWRRGLRQATPTACGTASSSTGPFYCPPDQTLYVDTTFFDSLSQFGYQNGNLAEAYVVAHEYGHHIENELGIFDIADRSGSGANSDSVKVELMADCLAGVWVGHAATTPDPDTGVPFLNPVTQDQLDNALAAAASVGDDRIQQTIQGEADPHTFTHGTSQQRTDAFTTGYTNGTVASCDAFGVIGR